MREDMKYSDDIKDLDTIKNELLQLNKKMDSFIFNKCLYQIQELKKLKKVYCYNNINSIKLEFNNIRENFNDTKNQLKLICLMIYANQLVFGFYPRDTQLIALLFFIHKPKDSGLIQQIMTGEGKSLIISFLATFLNLVHKKKIDILTSSIILAERDCNLFRNFYNIFDIATDFCREGLNTNNNKKCYDADILYGDCLNFEADILRTTFLGAPGRGFDRDYQCIIIDEIDNICIDNIKNITELLDDFPGYKLLEYIYIYIYNLLIKIDKEYKQNDVLIHIEKEKIIYRLTNEFEKFLNKNEKEKFDLIYYPTFLHDYILLRKKEWCRNAFEAKYEFQKNKQYIISDDEYGNKVIKPIDYYNTGVTQQNSVWPGLHQFLELKEGLNLSPENLNSCYMSNLTFFKKYKNSKSNNIYGLTGTLGSEETQLALNKIYNMNFILMPTYKPNLLLPPEYYITNNSQDYISKIIDKIKLYSKTRAVLVIFEYIENIKEIKKKLYREDSIDINKIIIYKDSENSKESAFLKNNIQVGNIILSTNLAARGTDIKISKELEKNGGLHVILTFFPFSERVERQALGRAGRKGEKGSGELIIYSSAIDIEILKKKRKESEQKLYNQLMNEFNVRDGLYEKLFSQFCDLLLEIRSTDSQTKNNYILDVKEKWGFFLIKNNINMDRLQRIVDECKIYSIGANYFIIYLLIKTQENLEKILSYLKKLEDRLDNFISFYNEFIKNNIKTIIQYEKSEYNNLIRQIDDKLELFDIILCNINELKEQVKIKQEYPNIVLKIDNNRTLIKNLVKKDGKKFSKDIVNYIADLGIYFLYHVTYDKRNCCPM